VKSLAVDQYFPVRLAVAALGPRRAGTCLCHHLVLDDICQGTEPQQEDMVMPMVLRTCGQR
jgi:hypothetical protein